MWGRREVIAAFAVCFALTACRARIVSVTIQNDGPMSIQSVELIHEHGRVVSGQIPVGKTSKMKFPLAGETSYRLVVHFADGSTATSHDEYAEPGYEFLSRVQDGQVTTELSKLPAY